MKKFIVLVLVIAIVLGTMSGCAIDPPLPPPTTPSTSTTTSTSTPPEPEPSASPSKSSKPYFAIDSNPGGSAASDLLKTLEEIEALEGAGTHRVDMSEVSASFEMATANEEFTGTLEVLGKTPFDITLNYPNATLVILGEFGNMIITSGEHTTKFSGDSKIKSATIMGGNVEADQNAALEGLAIDVNANTKTVALSGKTSVKIETAVPIAIDVKGECEIALTNNAPIIEGKKTELKVSGTPKMTVENSASASMSVAVSEGTPSIAIDNKATGDNAISVDVGNSGTSLSVASEKPFTVTVGDNSSANVATSGNGAPTITVPDGATVVPFPKKYFVVGNAESFTDDTTVLINGKVYKYSTVDKEEDDEEDGYFYPHDVLSSLAEYPRRLSSELTLNDIIYIIKDNIELDSTIFTDTGNEAFVPTEYNNLVDFSKVNAVKNLNSSIKVGSITRPNLESAIKGAVQKEKDTYWINNADTSWYVGNETSIEFTLSTAAQLSGLSKLVEGDVYFENKTIKLGANIDLGGKLWTPIGSHISDKALNAPQKGTDKPFLGSFDGQEKTISNLKINQPNDSNIGFFGNFGNSKIFSGNGTADNYAKNVNFENASVIGGQNIGVFAGYYHGQKISGINLNNITVEQVDSIPKSAYMGGLIGKTYAFDISNISMTGRNTIFSKNPKSKHVGGIFGFTDSNAVSLYNLSVDGLTINVKGTAGGICGSVTRGSTMTNCMVSNSTITNSGVFAADDYGSNAGGIFGYMSGGEGTQGVVILKNCSVTNTIVSSNHESKAFNIACSIYYIGVDKNANPVSESNIKSVLEDETQPFISVYLSEDMLFEVDDIITIPEGKTVKLNLNGKKITVSEDFIGRPFVNKGTLIVDDFDLTNGMSTRTGMIDSSKSSLGGYGAINNFGKVIINDGIFRGAKYGDGSSLANRYGGVAVINGGRFDGSTVAVYNFSGGVMTVNGGYFENESCSSCAIIDGHKDCWSYTFRNDGDLTFHDGRVVGTQGALGIGAGKAHIYGGAFEARQCVVNDSHTADFYALYTAGERGNVEVHVFGGTFKSNRRAAILVGNDNDGGQKLPAAMSIHGGTITTGKEATVIIEAPKTGNLVIDGGSFNKEISEEYLVNGYSAVKENGMFVVKKKVLPTNG